MRYQANREHTAELLRMVLPLMARHRAGFHPMSYAVWYEYLAGINPQLNAAVDARLNECNELTDADIGAIYERHIGVRDAETSARVGAEIARLVQQVDGAASEANDEMRQYGAELDTCRLRLQQHVEPEQLDQMVQGLILNTTRARDSTELFHEQLRQNAQEVQRLRAELEIAQVQACRDALTGLLNRRGFDLQLQHDWAQACGASSLLIVDIDRFKSVNDAHGHLLGDKVIMAVGRALHTCAGNLGPIARIGGEEFSALLLRTPAHDALGVAERVRALIERGRIRRTDADDQSIGGVTVSIGVAVSLDGEQFEALMARADRALYASKSAGRNRVTLWQQRASSEEPEDRMAGDSPATRFVL